ncbi:MAG: HPr(Ser) kinase/phosphatase [Ignavibacteria bacterium]|nr:HPr(Ser) kinase/phosphatase [Ignavibacteria bacterium]
MTDILKDIKQIKKDSITVEFFYEQCKDRFQLEKVTKRKIGRKKLITEKDLHRPGLAIAGYVELFSHNRIQILGNTENKYLKKLSKKEASKKLKRYFSFEMPCIIFTDKNIPSEEFLALANEMNVPIFCTPHHTTRFASLISDFLDDQFSPQAAIHSSFVDVYGIGLMFCGKSGIGKSEIALDLVERGHRLVADDIVIVSKKAENVLMGSGTSLVKHFMEIRGLGIIDIKQIFGIRAIRFQKRVEVIVELETWDSTRTYERTGLDTKTVNILGVDVEKINLPIFPGKNITVIAEVIALNYLCKHYGYDAAKVFEKQLAEKIKFNTNTDKPNNGTRYGRSTEYFEHDFE